MERLINSLRARLIAVGLVIHAALAPLLYLGVAVIVEEGYAESFINSVRSFSRLTADELEMVDEKNFEEQATALLDGVVLTGQVVFTEVIVGPRKLHSSLARD